MKKTGLLILALVLALGTLGIGYAAWSQTLSVAGSATIAKWDVHFANVVSSDPKEGATDPNGTYLAVDTTGMPTAFGVTLVGGYPGYAPYVDFDIVNDSTVPVKLTSYEYSLTSSSGPWHTWTGEDVTLYAGDSNKDLYIGTNYVLPGQSLYAGSHAERLHITVNPAIDATKSYAGVTRTFWIRYVADQAPRNQNHS